MKLSKHDFAVEFSAISVISLVETLMEEIEPVVVER